MYRVNLIERIILFTCTGFEILKSRVYNKTRVYTFVVSRTCGKVGRNLRVNGPTLGFGKNVELGDNVNINGCEIMGRGKVVIGNYFHSGKNITIFTSNHNYEGAAIPYDRERVTKNVTIKDFVWLGQNIIILPGVTIGEGAVVAAGSVVSKDVPDCAIVAGVPAKVVKWRDKERFEKLKSEGKFF